MKNSLFTNGLRKAVNLAFLALFIFAFSGINLNGQSPCDNDINDPIFSNCGPRSVTLDEGICTSKLLPALSATDNCPSLDDSFTHNEDEDISEGFGCLIGDASFYQVFTPANLPRFTTMTMTSIELGVFEAVNNPNVVVRIYLTDGGLNPATWTQIGGGSLIIPATNGTPVSIPVSSADILPSQTFAIEVTAPTSAVYGAVVAVNNGGQIAPTYYRSSACGINALTDLETILGNGYGMAMVANVALDGVYITQALNNPYPVDHDFTEGVYNLSYIATDASGNSSSCNFTFTVNGAIGVVSSIACNDLVQISLDTICEAIVEPDQILEGGPYGCFDDYEVIIYNKLNQPIGNGLTSSYIGQTLKVSVFDANGNSCWGILKVEDKNPAPLNCAPIYTTCIGDLSPGSPLPQTITVQAILNGATIPNNNKYAREFFVNVYGLGNAIITDLDVMVDIEHQNVHDLQVTITSPQGLTRKLFGGVADNCAYDDIRVSLDDEAANGYAALQSTCAAATPAVAGNFKPEQGLNVYDNQSPIGQWKITVIDSTTADGGQVNELAIVFKQSGGTISFPTPNPVTFVEQGPGYYTVWGIDPCGPATMGYTDEIRESDCSSLYSKVIARTWSATDASGNVSPSCTQYIYVYRNGLASLRFPPNYDGIDQPALSCLVWGDQVPGPEVTGSPTGDFCDNVQIFPYEDTRIDVCPKSYKIIRKWKLLEWCNSQVIEHTQIIKVIDDQGPKMECPADVTISTDALDCNRDYTPEKPVVTVECSGVLTYDLYYYSPDASGQLPQGAVFIKDNVVNGTILDLPAGINYLMWRVWDQCGNFSECIYKVTVRDEVPPVAVCDQFTKVSVGSNGIGKVAAFTFDDISNDNCEIVNYTARKMTNKCALGTTSTFRDTIVFCCEEVGTSIMVEFRVTDKAGNRNTCMVEVKVEDKLPPYITKCPADITLDCQADYKNLSITGEPIYIDNCKINSVGFADSGLPDQCGEGIIRRTWTVKDAQGLSASCEQRITLIDKDPFDKNDIIWPLDYEATTCHSDLNPENLPLLYAYPRVTDDDCSLTSITYKDQHFTFVDGACEKILRTWTVIDWCTYVENTGIGIYTDLQVIKLANKINPAFSSCRDSIVNIFDDCKGPVTIAASAYDDCTPVEQIKYSYRIDLNDDGIEDFGLAGTTQSFTHTLPIGKHRVYWTAEDKCSNKTFCNYLLTVRDGKKPTPYCLSSITTVVMPSSGIITIWANDFDHGSFDNCTPKEKLKFSFSTNVNNTSKSFTCKDIPDGIESEIPVEMWVTDEAGNQDYCTVSIIIQDNTGDVCPDDIGSRVVLGGRIKTEQNKSLNGAVVTLWEQNTKVDDYLTTDAGNFVLEDVLKNRNYSLSVDKNTDALNGLSTLDIVLIQRHILGVSRLDSPYKVIASDINNDGKVLASDLVALRKLILGLSVNMPSGQKSWRFINATSPFANASNPFPFEERIALDNLSSSLYNLDFYGVKIGDVNASSGLNVGEIVAEPRSSEALALEYETVETTEGTKVRFYAAASATLYGFQMSLSDMGNVRGMEAGMLKTGDEHYAHSDRGFAMSWNDDAGVNINKGDLLFSILTDKTIEGVEFAGIIKEEAYLSVNEVSEIALSRRNQMTSTSPFEVFQNEPNPFSQQTRIGFRLPEAAKVNLKIYDQSGKILFMQQHEFEKGLNHFTVNNSDLQASGIMYYEVSSNQFKATRKMIGLK
ncbi:MAG: T9SS type A sorting domain-containing protein [Saprospiraceae bacterium]|nr:T9SS type A sorting domain-containing protein [Saprospiraceae bacterium]